MTGEKYAQECQVFDAATCDEHDLLPSTNGDKRKAKDMKKQEQAADSIQSEGQQAKQPAPRRTGPEANTTIRRIVLGGSTLATCGAGLDIRHILCGFDSCYLTIKNLPQNVKSAEIEDLFTQQDIDTSLFFIMDLQRVKEGPEAKIMADAEVGRIVAATLDGMIFGNNNVLNIALDDSNSASSTSERDKNMLTVTWASPSVTMVALYGSTMAARNAVNKLDNTVFRGHKVRAELVQGPSNKSSTSVKLTGLPWNVTYKEVEHRTGAYLVRTPHPSPLLEKKNVERDLRRHIEQIARFRMWEVCPTTPDQPSVEVHVQFLNSEDARKAHDSLKGWAARQDYPSVQSWLSKPTQHSIVVPLAQYRAQRNRWDSMTERKGDKAPFLQITDNGSDSAFIRVIGEDKKAVGRLKVRVENLVAGEVLDTQLWHRTFMTASGRRFLDDVGSRTGAYIRADWKTRTLRLCAEGGTKQSVIRLLKAEIARLESSERSIAINRRASSFFLHKGLLRLEKELGEGAATLDLTSRRLIVRGGETAYRAVNQLIEESQNNMGPEAHDGQQALCPICFDEVSLPVSLSCGHFYCTPCIRHFLSSAVERKAFPLTCAGDEDRCKAPIAIPIIQRFLPQRQFDQLVEAAVATYIEKNPTKLKYCTTPDCPQVHRYDRGCGSLTCPSCFATVCTGCHKEAHEGMTCREREIMENEDHEPLTEEWAKTSGAKRCPSCRVWIEKTAGCNHVACLCGVHICWVCLKAFDGSNGVYDHLRLIHGGVYNNEAHAEGGVEQGDLAYAQVLQREGDEYAQAQIDPEFRVDNRVIQRDPEYEQEDRGNAVVEWHDRKGPCIIM